MNKLIASHLLEAKTVLEQFVSDESNLKKIEEAAKLMVDSLKKGGKIISCGNGGSMSDAMHFAEELTGRFREDRSPIAAIAISDPAHISCVANDYGFEHVFSRYVEAVGKEGDVLLAISTSGNSANVLNAAKQALDRGMKVVALTGKDGGELARYCTIELRAPYTNYSDRVQEIHIKIIHVLIACVESELNPI
jgi:D-sedoheptulose 7-phosphate isomerase